MKIAALEADLLVSPIPKEPLQKRAFPVRHLYKKGLPLIPLWLTLRNVNVNVINSAITGNQSFGIYTATQPSSLSLLETRVESNQLGDVQEGDERIFYTFEGNRLLDRDLTLLRNIKVYESIEEVMKANPKFVAPVTSPPQKPKEELSSKAGPLTPSSPGATISGLAQLQQLIGLTSIKREVVDLIQRLEFNKELTKFGLSDGQQHSYAEHLLLYGNPGTGKPTVAKIMGQIYKELGLLEKGHIVQVNREKLVGQYIGHTAVKTQEKINEAMGGVLFIDEEAYQLTQYGASDSGHKVIEVLLKYMEDYRGKFNVIVAGYPTEMEQFLNSNAGLQRRFVHQFQFEDYAPII